jgi:hypothetical protein
MRESLSQKMTVMLDIEPNTPKEEHQEVVEYAPQEIIDTTAVSVPSEHEKDIAEDYKLARKTLRNLVATANTGLSGIEDLASTSDHPRAYEAFAAMLKAASDTTKDLLTLHDMKNKLSPFDKQKMNSGQTINVEKAVFVGSTVELLRKIKEKMNEDN